MNERSGMTTLEKIRTEQAELFNASGIGNTFVCYKALQIIDKYADQEPTDEWQNGYDTGWEEAKVFYEKEEPTSPCDLCRFNPPSSADGKPCTMCPAEKGGAE